MFTLLKTNDEKSKDNYKVDLTKVKDLINFTKLMSERVKNTVKATDGKFVVNAKSLNMMLELAIKPIDVKLESSRTPDIINFNEICKNYEVKK